MSIVDDKEAGGFEMYGRGTTVTTSTARKGKLDPDNISEESFLPMQGIRKTM